MSPPIHVTFEVQPLSFNLKQNFPNPFNPSTQIAFTLPEDTRVIIEVYNALGQKIAVLLDKPMTIGHHQIEFNGHNLPSGIYFYKIVAGKFQDMKKMILLK